MEYKESKSKINLASLALDVVCNNDYRLFEDISVKSINIDSDCIDIHLIYRLHEPVRFIDMGFSCVENSDNNS